MPWIDLEVAPPEEGAHRVVPLPGGPRGRSVVVTRVEGALAAYRNECRHVPIPLDAGLGELPPGPELVCSTHGARFRARDGLCVHGPCEGRSLHRVAVREEEGRVWIEVGADPRLS